MTSTPQLVVMNGAHKGDVIVLDDPMPVVFGRRCGIALPERALAGVHCQVFLAQGRWFLQDFGSEAGTYMGDLRVEGVRPLQLGRTFRIGETHVGFLLPTTPTSSDGAGDASSGARAPLPDGGAAAPLPHGGAAAPLPHGWAAAPPGEEDLYEETTELLEYQVPKSGSDAGQAPAEALRGPQAIGDYDVLEQLGEGSLGRVYRGYDRRRRRVVALKVLDPALARDERQVARFLRGAKLGARLTHRHIVQVLAAGHASGFIYVTMEFVAGLNLEQFCQASGGRLMPTVALGIADRVADALAHAHAHGVLHRNVTPRNVLIGPGGFPKLADLALAKRSRRQRDLDISDPGQSAVAPSPYAAPEALPRFQRAEGLDERADVYGLAATLFHALTGVPPYGDDLNRLAGRLFKRELEDARRRAPELSPQAIALLERCLTLRVDERLPSVRALREAIALLPDMTRG